MPHKKKNESVIAICVQELTEVGSTFDLGGIKGEDLRFLHQAFITDTITAALDVGHADVRLYSIAEPERRRYMKIICEYLQTKLNGKRLVALQDRFSALEQPADRWGHRMEKVFMDCFDAGYQHVLLVGSRTPTISPNMMKLALKMLNESDAVFGPTPEGRYYSLGMSGSYQIPMASLDWESPDIYSEVAEAFTSRKLSWAEMEIWYAVESPEYFDTMVRDINQFRFEGDEQTARETEMVVERILTRLDP